MARLLPKTALDVAIAAVRRHPEGATFIQVAAAIDPPQPMRNVQRWLSMLVKQGRLDRVGHANTLRYQWVDPDAVGPMPGGGVAFPAATPVTQALQTLVGQPVGLRPPVSYHRDWLDAYRPNVTFYLPPEVRALGDAGRPLAGAGGAAAGNEQPMAAAGAASARIVADLAWRAGWLEGGTLTLPQVESLVAGEPVDCDLREAELVRRQQAAWMFLVANAPRLTLTRDVLLTLYATIAGLDPAAPVELRRQALAFAGSTYHPPADPVLIEACLAQVLATAAAIAHPLEQAFFGFVHLLALQPLPSFNASVACHALNLPLLRANLCPITFASVAGRDLLDAVIVVWELNRPELLAEVFARAYADCQDRYMPGRGAAASETLKS